MERNLVSFLQAELLHDHRYRSRGCVLKRNFYFKLVRLGGLPFCRKAFAVFVFQTHFADTAGFGRLQMESVLAPNNQSAGVFGSYDPLCGSGGPQAEARAVERTEAPESAQDPARFAVEAGRLHGLSLDDKTAVRGIGLGGEIDPRSRFSFNMENEAVCQVGGEDQRGTVHRKNECGLVCTEDLGRIHGSQRWLDRGTNGRQANHQHRLWITE